MKKNNENNYRMMLRNVRLSFPNLFQTATFGGEDTGKYDASFLLDKAEHKEEIAAIKENIELIVKNKFKGKNPGTNRLCLKDGDETDREEQRGCYILKASTKRRPLVLNRDKSSITEDDNVIYAGCYVNAIVTLWAQDNAYGKRINGHLEGVQFCGHGEPFGPPAIDADEFDVFGTDDDIPF
jgi:hypothetical protein